MELRIHMTKPKKWFSPFSWLIRFVEKRDFSHVVIEITVRDLNIPIYFEASGSYLKFLSEQVFVKKQNIVKTHSIPIDKIAYEQIMGALFNYAGVDYGVKQIIGIGIVKFKKELCGVTIKNPYGDGRKSQVCSEIAGVILQEILDIDVGVELDSAGPSDIDKVLEKYKKEIQSNV